ncbi:MAG: OmpA family protein [Pedobacter sp.]|uniref:OmpA family protein n=1 Tax=Pedobacter sp. TaxID=1411316 RepID=UPI002807005D|nr:OmpA family protein [Pedobacter sp.]MDQ8006534.1 OmpA family protein [Pedobacter sp.]
MLYKGFLLILFYISFFATQAAAQKKKTTSFFFDTDLSVLDEKQKEAFSQFVSEMEAEDIVSISILGYCDDRGRKGYNDTLSIKRANYVKDLLHQRGINTDKVKLLTGNGKVDLAEQNNVTEQRAYNRRVDLVIGYVKRKFANDNSILSDTLKVGDKIILENILFENSRSVLLEESIPVLERITNIIKEKKQYNIAILGHICCNPPGRDVKDFETGEYNLSQARAKIIYDYLIYKGVDKKRLTYKGMMANFPLGKGEKNDRRVELQITGINTK